MGAFTRRLMRGRLSPEDTTPSVPSPHRLDRYYKRKGFRDYADFRNKQQDDINKLTARDPIYEMARDGKYKGHWVDKETKELAPVDSSYSWTEVSNKQPSRYKVTPALVESKPIDKLRETYENWNYYHPGEKKPSSWSSFVRSNSEDGSLDPRSLILKGKE